MVTSSPLSSSPSGGIITSIAVDASPSITPATLSSASSLYHVAAVDLQHGDNTLDKRPNKPLKNHVITSTTAIPTNENFKNRIILGTKLMGDVLVAVTVTAMAAPFLAVIDKALVERTTAATVTTVSSASATTTTRNRITVWTSMYHSSITILQQPIKFLRSPTFLWMWGTYAATYTAANTLRTLLTAEKTPNVSPNTVPTLRDDKNSITHGYSKYLPSSGTTLLLGTSIVNSTASVMKDRAYAQLYGATKAATTSSIASTKLNVPNITYGLWLLRDLTVIGAAFVLPNHVAQFWIQQKQASSVNNPYSPQFSDATIIRLSQIGTPVMAQVIAGPLHFIGYDCYNHYNGQASLHNNNGNQFRAGSFSSYQFWYERLNNLRSSVGQVIVARMMRIIPGYGIAGICNTELLLQWKNRIVQPLIESDDLWYRDHNHTNTEIEKTCTNVNTAVWNEHNQHRC
jgi:hypothetical protein